MGNEWQLKEHNEVERPYWEITNGPISLCVNDEDFDDEQKIVQYRLSIVVQRLNDLNVGFHSENALEIKQHIEIMQLRDQAKAMADALESLKSLGWQNWQAQEIADKALQQFKDGKGKEVENEG